MGTITIAGQTFKSGRDRKGMIIGLLATVIFGMVFFLGDDTVKGLTFYLLFFSITYFIVSCMQQISYCRQCNEIFDYGTKVCPDCGSYMIKDTFKGDIEKKVRAKLNEQKSVTVTKDTDVTHEPTKELLTNHYEQNIITSSAFGYKGATIIFKVKIQNNTDNPISDIKVYPYVSEVFLLKDLEKSIALIEPGSNQTVAFEIRPTGECGNCNVSGRVKYYDMVSRKHLDINLESKSLSIICPMLRKKEISEDAWCDIVSNFVKAEETTSDIPIDGEGLFGMVSEIIKDLNLFRLPPGITRAQQIFRGTARFYGEGVKGLRYAVQLEVVGGAKKSKLILKAWAEKEDALTGFYHGILDQIEKRINVKGYIDDSIVQYNVHIGDRIGTQIKDSVVQRSTIGASAWKCPTCGKEVEANEKFCMDCGARL